LLKTSQILQINGDVSQSALSISHCKNVAAGEQTGQRCWTLSKRNPAENTTVGTARWENKKTPSPAQSGHLHTAISWFYRGGKNTKAYNPSKPSGYFMFSIQQFYSVWI